MGGKWEGERDKGEGRGDGVRGDKGEGKRG